MADSPVSLRAQLRLEPKHETGFFAKEQTHWLTHTVSMMFLLLHKVSCFSIHMDEPPNSRCLDLSISHGLFPSLQLSHLLPWLPLDIAITKILCPLPFLLETSHSLATHPHCQCTYTHTHSLSETSSLLAITLLNTHQPAFWLSFFSQSWFHVSSLQIQSLPLAISPSVDYIGKTPIPNELCHLPSWSLHPSRQLNSGGVSYN